MPIYNKIQWAGLRPINYSVCCLFFVSIWVTFSAVILGWTKKTINRPSAIVSCVMWRRSTKVSVCTYNFISNRLMIMTQWVMKYWPKSENLHRPNNSNDNDELMMIRERQTCVLKCGGFAPFEHNFHGDIFLFSTPYDSRTNARAQKCSSDHQWNENNYM